MVRRVVTGMLLLALLLAGQAGWALSAAPGCHAGDAAASAPACCRDPRHAHGACQGHCHLGGCLQPMLTAAALPAPVATSSVVAARPSAGALPQAPPGVIFHPPRRPAA